MITDIKTHVIGFFAGLLASLGEISPKLQLVVLPNGTSAASIVRDGYKHSVVEGPAVFRRDHSIEDCASFSEWLKRHAASQTTCEILINDEQVDAALDPRNVNGCTVSMPLALHPRFARWFDLLSDDDHARTIGQRALHRHILSCLEDFVPEPVAGTDETISEGERLAMQLAKFHAVRNQEITVEYDALGYVRFASAKDNTEVHGTLPPKFTIRVPMFLDVQGTDGAEIFYDIELFLTVEPAVGKGPPTFALLCPQLEVARRKARLDVVAYLRRLLNGTQFLVGLGSFSTQRVIAPIAE